MAPRTRTVRYALGPAAVGVLLGGLALGWLVFHAAESARKPLGWAVAAAVVAAVLSPVVEKLAERMPRFLAVVVVFQLVGVAVGSLVFGTLQDLDEEAARLKQAAPEAAAELAASDGLIGDLAEDIDLPRRVETFIEELERPSSGVAADVASSAGAWLVGTVLTAFLLSWAPRLAKAGLRQISDDERRHHATVALKTAVTNGRRYLLGSVTLAIFVGMSGWAAADLEGAPAALALGVAAAAASVVPGIGVVVGGLPAVLLELGLGTTAGAVRLLAVFVLLQAAHTVVLRRFVARRSVVVGPAVVVIALVLGYDAYGIGGAYYAAALAVFGVALLDAAGKVQSDISGEVPVVAAPAPTVTP